MPIDDSEDEEEEGEEDLTRIREVIETEPFELSPEKRLSFRDTLAKIFPLTMERGKLTEIQMDIWSLKMDGKTLKQIAGKIYAAYGKKICEGAVSSAVKRTSIGRKWKPNAVGGREKYLNDDEITELALWLDGEIEPVTIAAMLEKVDVIHQATVNRAKEWFVQAGCPAQGEKLDQEVREKSRTWARRLADAMNYKTACPEFIELKRWEFGTSTLVSRWFQELMGEWTGVDPKYMFNFDETMVQASQGKCKVLWRKDHDHGPLQEKEGKKEHVTLGMCFSAVGQHPPPYILVPKKHVEEFKPLADADLATVRGSEKGWMTKDLFEDWAKEFVNWLEALRARTKGHGPEGNEQLAVLFLDNCSTHVSLEALMHLKEHNVKVITFPTHMTHVLQPIDVAMVRPFKARLKLSHRRFTKDPSSCVLYPSLDVTKMRDKRIILVHAVIDALAACSLGVAAAGFRATGLFPINVNKPLSSPYVRVAPNDPEREDVARRPNALHTGSTVVTKKRFLCELFNWVNRGRSAEEQVELLVNMQLPAHRQLPEQPAFEMPRPPRRDPGSP
jgi:hypothetical protein